MDRSVWLCAREGHSLLRAHDFHHELIARLALGEMRLNLVTLAGGRRLHGGFVRSITHITMAGLCVVIPNTVSPGDRLSASAFTVVNAGAATSGDGPGFVNAFYLSTDQTINVSDQLLESSSDLDSPHLATGGTQAMPATKLSIGSSLPFGTYYLGLLLDRNGSVNGVNEANNAIVIKSLLVGRSVDAADYLRAAASSSTRSGSSLSAPRQIDRSALACSRAASC